MKEFSDLYEISEDGCWLWKGKTMGNGRYGRIQVDNLSVGAHRFSYQLHHGPIPEGMCVCHRCDVPMCVNPDHLFVGTIKENWQDMVDKGRSGIDFKFKDERGESNGHAKLSEDDVRSIRRMKTAGGTYQAIRQRFGIKSNGHVRNILTGKLWGHIQG